METINFKNYRIEKGESNVRGIMKPNARIYKATPKGKWSKEKMVQAYYYGTEERREEAVAQFIANIERQEKDKEQRVQKKADAKANLINPFKVGDIFNNSWGYDQTNQDFYQVVEVGKKSVKIRKIAQKLLEYTGNGMAGKVIGLKDYFANEEVIQKNLQVYLDSTGKPVVYINSRHGSMSLWDGEPEYASWYA